MAIDRRFIMGWHHSQASFFVIIRWFWRFIFSLIRWRESFSGVVQLLGS
jgi:hypothetical protein